MEFSILIHCGEIDQVAYDIMYRVRGKNLKEVCTLKGVCDTNEFVHTRPKNIMLINPFSMGKKFQDQRQFLSSLPSKVY